MSEDRKYAAEIKAKLEFYFLGLVFTVLALSVQKGELIRPFGQFIVEISAWVALLISGLAGLSRMEWTAVSYLYMDQIKTNEGNLSRLEQAQGNVVDQNDGRLISPQELSEWKHRLDKKVKSDKKESKAVERRSQWKYRVHKLGFVVGLALLIVSRVLLALASFSQTGTKEHDSSGVQQGSPGQVQAAGIQGAQAPSSPVAPPH